VTDVVASAAQVVSSWGFTVTPDTLNQIANEVGEQSIISRAGGAPTLAVGMAYILHGSLGGLMDVSFWYHFAILFEALFILTRWMPARAARFMLQDLLGVISPPEANQLAAGEPSRHGAVRAGVGLLPASGRG
jgi:carbon starvation protein